MSEAGRIKLPLTLTLLNAALYYESDTGYLRRRIKAKKNKGNPGDIVGGVQGKHRYWRVRLYGIVYQGHRLAWALAHQTWPLPYDIDHINGNPSDNRLCNLRPATHAENLRNRRRPNRTKTHTTGVKGVDELSNGRFRARLIHNYKNIHIGCYATLEEARAAYNAKAQELQGDFFAPA